MTYWGKRQDANFWIENASVEWNEDGSTFPHGRAAYPAAEFAAFAG